MRILIIEDTKQVAEKMEATLAFLGFEVVSIGAKGEFLGGKSSVDTFVSETDFGSFDLILLDHELGGSFEDPSNGYMIIEKAKELNKDISPKTIGTTGGNKKAQEGYIGRQNSHLDKHVMAYRPVNFLNLAINSIQLNPMPENILMMNKALNRGRFLELWIENQNDFVDGRLSSWAVVGTSGYDQSAIAFYNSVDANIALVKQKMFDTFNRLGIVDNTGSINLDVLDSLDIRNYETLLSETESVEMRID